MVKGKIRILLAKMGLDGHDIALRTIANAFRQAGMEVIYLGPYQTPEKVLNATIQESVDIIGISSLSGEYNIFIPQLIELLKKHDLDKEVKILLGGLIVKEDMKKLKEIGVNEIFRSGDTFEKIIEYISNV